MKEADWRDVPTGPGMPGGPQELELEAGRTPPWSLRWGEGREASQHFDSRLLGLELGENAVPLGKCPVCGVLLQQPQETNPRPMSGPVPCPSELPPLRMEDSEKRDGRTETWATSEARRCLKPAHKSASHRGLRELNPLFNIGSNSLNSCLAPGYTGRALSGRRTVTVALRNGKTALTSVWGAPVTGSSLFPLPTLAFPQASAPMSPPVVIPV